MDDDGIVAGPVVSDEEGPPPAVAPVVVAAMEDIAVEKESISRLHLHFLQRQHLGDPTIHCCCSWIDYFLNLTKDKSNYNWHTIYIAWKYIARG